jgi:hypothetical protein
MWSFLEKSLGQVVIYVKVSERVRARYIAKQVEPVCDHL